MNVMSLLHVASAVEAEAMIAVQGLTPDNGGLLDTSPPEVVLLDDAALARAKFLTGQMTMSVANWEIPVHAGFFAASPAALRAQARRVLTIDGSGAGTAHWRASSHAPSSAAHAPRYPIDHSHPANKIRLAIARCFGTLYLGGVFIDPYPLIPQMIQPVFKIDPVLMRNPQDWLDLLKNSFFRALAGTDKKICVYDTHLYRSGPDPKMLKEPDRFYNPRTPPVVFHETYVGLFYARVLFEIKPDKKDLQAARTKGLEAFRERMWERFLVRLKRKLRAVEKS
ncbi:MAG: hypothetical protein HY609_00370 [Deltaproteobacteria bacterium]|nr:hypothetical protein [Deltaproteobacteria bacterium]